MKSLKVRQKKPIPIHTAWEEKRQKLKKKFKKKVCSKICANRLKSLVREDREVDCLDLVDFEYYEYKGFYVKVKCLLFKKRKR